MIDIKELRIGNEVSYQLNPYTVTGIDPNQVYVYLREGNNESHISVKPKYIEPILLTEQWLRDFRFQSTFSTDPQNWPASKCFNLDGFKIHQPIEDVDQFIFDPIVDDYIELVSVHQLQNLYFALTGKELTKK